MALPDAVIVCISCQQLSAARPSEPADSVLPAAPIPAMLVRLKGTGPHLGEALDQLVFRRLGSRHRPRRQGRSRCVP